MVQKRPLGEEVYDVSAKQPRHLEPNDEKVSFLEFPGFIKSKSENYELLDVGDLTDLQTHSENEIKTGLPDFNSNSSGTTSTTSEEDVKSEAPFCILLSADHYNLGLPTRTIVHGEEIYSYHLEHSPRKLVPIGNDFQAEVPDWDRPGETFPGPSSGDAFEVLNEMSQSFKSDISDYPADVDKFTGSCVIPMPESLASADTADMLRGGRSCCTCDDMGSIRCVQQHISEAREKLMETLGEETFTKLGFWDMGEVVAEKWSEDEEQIFHEVVFSNPVSLGRNFWNHLAIGFPSRTMKEIVSYYFNVFMLRRRAEQNRVDVLDIDSDNDEWEGVDVSADRVIDKINAYEDCVDESPVHEDDFSHNEKCENDLCKYQEDITSEISEDDMNESLELKGGKCITGSLKACPNNVLKNCSSGRGHQPLDQGISHELRKHDDRGVPSTSDKIGDGPDLDRENHRDVRHWTGNISGLASNSGHEFLLEPCSSKEWNGGYLSCAKEEDFLPTCSVIEEVFSAKDCNYKPGDGWDTS